MSGGTRRDPGGGAQTCPKVGTWRDASLMSVFRSRLVDSKSSCGFGVLEKIFCRWLSNLAESFKIMLRYGIRGI